MLAGGRPSWYDRGAFHMMFSIGAPFLAALLLSLSLVPICRVLALRFGFVARPRQDRWHQRPVALLGGVGIAVVVFACAAAFHLLSTLPVVMVTATLMFATGLVDDLLSLKPATKLIAQIALASTLLFFNYRLNWVESITLDTLLTLFWIVGLTNAFNLLDNMDGLCAGIVLIAGTALLIGLLPAATTPRAMAEAQFLAIVLGATGGFLAYNLHPASIFMGDSGSLLLGFSLAVVTFSSGEKPGRSDVLSIVAAPLLILLIPIFDTTLVTLSRWVSGRSASEGGRDHSSHRLVAIGLSERRAVLLLWFLAAIGGVLGIALEHVSQSWSAIAVVAFLIGMGLFAAYLARVRVYDDQDVRVRQSLTPIVVEFMHKRRVAEVLLDFCLVCACYYIAYRLRFEDPEEFMKHFDMFTNSLPIVVATQLSAFFVVGVYRGAWRHFGMMDTLVVARGVLFGTCAAVLTIVLVPYFLAYSRTAFAIYALLLISSVTLSRASFRLIGEFVRRQRRAGRRIAIYGAGDGAGMVLREVLPGDFDSVRMVGFIDDDPRKAGVRVMGYPVLGGYSALAVLVRTASVDAVVISARSLTPERLNNLRVLCADANVSLMRLRVDLEVLVDAGGDRDDLLDTGAIRQFRS
jgi:UDP-GlcNAc:undecaprenyl-phosphate/decaprenyl-phosphate GlcNAc-1-phosphate transferase